MHSEGQKVWMLQLKKKKKKIYDLKKQNKQNS